MRRPIASVTRSRSMEKDLFVFGAGSSSGQKRVRAGGDDRDADVDREPNCELSLGAIFGGAVPTSAPKVDADAFITIEQQTLGQTEQCV